MKTVTSVSGGRTSAYVAANYPSDYNLFALVRTDDQDCRFPDETIRKVVEDRIQKPFVGTLEDDMIIYTMLDLEQYLGRPIQWVSGISYDELIESRGYLPNKMHRICTHVLKLEPMFEWWSVNIGEPVEARIGFRANETNRANNTLAQINSDGLLLFKATFEKHVGGRHDGLNKWEMVPWQKPVFPLIDDNVYKDEIVSFWKDKPVRFAAYNNCVGCFHRNAAFLKFMFSKHPNKMNWFKKKEQGMGKKYATWRNDITYASVEKMLLQMPLYAEDFQGCDDGFCEIN